MQKIAIFIIIIFTQISYQSFAQQSSKSKSDRLFDKAAQSYDRRDYTVAIKTIESILADDATYAKAWLLKADIYIDLGEKQSAIAAYKSAVAIDSTVFPPAYYIMGNLYFDLEKYSDAKLCYQKYLLFKPKIQAELRRMDNNLMLCDFRQKLKDNPVPFDPQNIGPNVNSQGSEYVNAISLDESELYFTRKGNDQRSDESFYRSVSAVSAGGILNWSPAIEIGAPINTPGNEGALCVSPDNTTIIITCCSRGDSYGSCDLYSAHKMGNTWTEPVNLGTPVNTASWESQPCLAADGRTLFFVSTRRGGFGGSDIYKSVLQDDGYWSAPVNLGDKVNTSADEMAPFIHPDGKTLYFSSAGHPGMGASDLFVSRLDSDGNFQTPENLGYPVNTNRDEINLLINAAGNQAYISADRANGYGNIDIYRFELPAQFRPSIVSYVKGKVYDKNSSVPLEASFELIDLQSNTVVVKSISEKLNGQFVMSLPVDKQYALNVSCPGYLFFSTNFNMSHSSDNQPLVLDVPMQRIIEGEKVVLRNIFFDSDKYELLPDSKAELNRLIDFMNKNPNLKIEIGGHTDNEGSDAHNLTLSQNRAKAVFEFLIAAGIKTEKLSYKGYGETMPLNNNDTPEARAWNRRTEFKVLNSK